MYDLPMPTVKNTICIGGFTLYAYAYRPLTKSECKLALQQYMRQNRLKSVPQKGTAKIFTLFGSNPESGL